MWATKHSAVLYDTCQHEDQDPELNNRSDKDEVLYGVLTCPKVLPEALAEPCPWSATPTGAAPCSFHPPSYHRSPQAPLAKKVAIALAAALSNKMGLSSDLEAEVEAEDTSSPNSFAGHSVDRDIGESCLRSRAHV